VIPFGCQDTVPSVSLSIWKTKRNHRGFSPLSRRDEDENHAVISHKCGFQGHVGSSVIVMRKAAVTAPKYRSFFFVTHLLSRASKRHGKSQS
jgi:hypothetical protein